MGRHSKSTKKIYEDSSSSDDEYISDASSSSESTDEEVAPKHKQKRARTTTKVAREKKVAKPVDYTVEQLREIAQKEYDTVFRSLRRKPEGEARSRLPKNTALYLDVRNEITDQIDQELMVEGKGRSVANHEALKAARTKLHNLDYAAAFRIPYEE